MDRYLLEYIAKKSGYSPRQLADVIGIDRSTMRRKLIGESDFTRAEIMTMKDTLHLSPEQIDLIFFKNGVAETQQERK